MIAVLFLLTTAVAINPCIGKFVYVLYFHIIVKYVIINYWLYFESLFNANYFCYPNQHQHYALYGLFNLHYFYLHYIVISALSDLLP